MDPLSNKQIQAMRAEAQSIEVTFHVGKGGVTPAAIEELGAQLKKRKLVKARLLPAATEEKGYQEQAQALAAGTGSTLVEVRGHTAVFWKA